MLWCSQIIEFLILLFDSPERWVEFVGIVLTDNLLLGLNLHRFHVLYGLHGRSEHFLLSKSLFAESYCQKGFPHQSQDIINFKMRSMNSNDFNVACQIKN